MNKFEYVNVKSLEQAVSLLPSDDFHRVKIKAGGVDLLDEMKERLYEPRRLVNIRHVSGLDYVKEDVQQGLRLGPLATLTQVAEHPIIRERYRILVDSITNIATPQIRNMATIGGNICQRPRCWYYRSAQFHCLRKAGDLCYAQNGENKYHAIFANDLCAIVHPSGVATALMALGAKLKILGSTGTRLVAMDDFFVTPDVDILRENILKPNELISEIIVPRPRANTRSHYLKQKEKEAFDWPTAEVAVALTLKSGVCTRARVVLGAAAPIPWRARDAEKALLGKPITEARAAEAARRATSGATPLEQNKYKIPLFQAIVRRAILAAAA
jgi:xanthine dehydrogenase YagS FAD-binding subunit